MNIRHAGSTGVDYSVTPAAIPMATFSLLATIPANPARCSVEVQNQSAGTVQVVKDDGNGLNQVSILLATGGSVGTQGGSWNSQTFKGRVRVYAVAGAQISISQE